MTSVESYISEKMIDRLKLFLMRSSRPEISSKKGVLRNFVKFSRKQLCQSLFFNKVAGRSATLLKKRLWRRCFPVNFTKFLRTPFLTEHLQWLHLTWHQLFSGNSLRISIFRVKPFFSKIWSTIKIWFWSEKLVTSLAESIFCTL